MKTIIIISLLVLISYSSQQQYYSIIIGYDTLYKCPDDKIKIGEDVCAIKTSEGCSKDIPYKVYIKKKSCGKNKECGSKFYSIYNLKSGKSCRTTDYIYNCQKKFKLLKIGKKCNYNAECNTGYCNNHKCAAYGDDVKCVTDENNCAPGKYCKNDGTRDGSGNTLGICTSYLGEGEVCSSTTAECAPGLYCHKTSSSATSSTCTKYFSVGKGDYAEDDILCKSLFLVDDKCAEIISVDDDTCTMTYNNGGTDTSVSNLLTTLEDGTNVCNYKAGVKDLVSDIVKRYDKIKLNKILEKDNCDYESIEFDSDTFKTLCDKKYAELFSVYKYYGPLLRHGIIKENGKKNKKCEYEFWRTVSVSSSYVNVYLLFAFTLLGLLF